MITQLRVRGFSGVPYLTTSALIKRHPQALSFSMDRPNVVVGPNGSGKSALLSTLAIRFLAYYTGESAFDNQYLTSRESEAWWSQTSDWRHDFTFLKGLDCETDNGPTLYYRPNHVPGNETSPTHALLMGYDGEARAYLDATRAKSSGQANQALLKRLHQALTGASFPVDYAEINWRYGREPIDLRTRDGWAGSMDYKAEALKAAYAQTQGIPLVLMDEPEQSLDALAEAELWKTIEAVHCGRMQVIVATHSLYPLLHPERFNLIESTSGYIDRVLKLLK